MKKFHFIFQKLILESLNPMNVRFLKKFFDQRSGNGLNNSISCLENSISYLLKHILESLNQINIMFQKNFFDAMSGNG